MECFNFIPSYLQRLEEESWQSDGERGEGGERGEQALRVAVRDGPGRLGVGEQAVEEGGHALAHRHERLHCKQKLALTICHVFLSDSHSHLNLDAVLLPGLAQIRREVDPRLVLVHCSLKAALETHLETELNR